MLLMEFASCRARAGPGTAKVGYELSARGAQQQQTAEKGGREAKRARGAAAHANDYIGIRQHAQPSPRRRPDARFAVA
jgi:hypothetical protein